jgi:hypothetical protein
VSVATAGSLVMMMYARVLKERAQGEGSRRGVAGRNSWCVFITAVPIIKLFAWGEGDSGGHVTR